LPYGRLIKSEFNFQLACLSPLDRFFEENVSTLSYAQMAGGITNQPVKNDDPNARIIRELKVEIDFDFLQEETS
jgi:hypothetical protein